MPLSRSGFRNSRNRVILDDDRHRANILFRGLPSPICTNTDLVDLKIKRSSYSCDGEICRCLLPTESSDVRIIVRGIKRRGTVAAIRTAALNHGRLTVNGLKKSGIRSAKNYVRQAIWKVRGVF